MFTSNPFAELSASIPPAVMQTYVVIMIILVAGGEGRRSRVTQISRGSCNGGR